MTRLATRTLVAEPRRSAESAEDGVSIVIPAYKEERGIGPVLQSLRGIVEQMRADVPVEVIVVDDGSPDKTADAVQPYVDDVIRLVRHPKNRGYGASLKTGIHHARYRWIVITDADGTYPNEDIPKLVALRDEFEMVVGSRTGAVRNIPWLRRPPKWVLNKLASYLSQRDIPDLNSGLRLMRRDVVERFTRILPDGFSFTTTITLAMLSCGYAVKYMPIDYHKREGTSKIRPIHDTLNFLKLIIRTIMFFDPLRVFIPVSAIFMLAALGVGVGSSIAGKLMDVTTVLLFSTSVQLLAIGMLADMVNRRLD